MSSFGVNKSLVLFYSSSPFIYDVSQGLPAQLSRQSRLGSSQNPSDLTGSHLITGIPGHHADVNGQRAFDRNQDILNGDLIGGKASLTPP